MFVYSHLEIKEAIFRFKKRGVIKSHFTHDNLKEMELRQAIACVISNSISIESLHQILEFSRHVEQEEKIEKMVAMVSN